MSTFPKDAKSLVKHLLTQDLGKRYGNLKRGVKDIKMHRWFKNFDWKGAEQMKMDAPYKPSIKSPGDVSHYSEQPDSPDLPKPIRTDQDVFLNW